MNVTVHKQKKMGCTGILAITIPCILNLKFDDCDEIND